jgi:hypothetical protein
LTELTKQFLTNVQAVQQKDGKIRKSKLNDNSKSKKRKKYKRNQLNFKTPPPNIGNMTIDPGELVDLNMRSFQEFSDEPEINIPQKRNINMLKASISKLSIDAANDRQFLMSMIQRNGKRNMYQSNQGSPFVKSFENYNFDQTNNKLPAINQSTAIRNGTIKSPVMQSIRMSRQNKSNAFASLQKYRGKSIYDNENSDDGKSDKSELQNIRASFISPK